MEIEDELGGMGLRRGRGCEVFGSFGMINRGRLRLVRVENFICFGCEIFLYFLWMR